MITTVVICDSCGSWHRGNRKELPRGWRSKYRIDICPICPDPPQWVKKLSTTERNREMLALRRTGIKYREIAKRYGISPSRVQAICRMEERKEWVAESKKKPFNAPAVASEFQPWS